MTPIPFMDRVMEHHNPLCPDLNFLVVLARVEILAELSCAQGLVVVPVDEVNIPLQTAQRSLCLFDTAERHIAKVIDAIPWTNTLVPVIDQQFVVLFERALGPRIWTELLYSVMTEVRIRGEPNITHG